MKNIKQFENYVMPKGFPLYDLSKVNSKVIAHSWVDRDKKQKNIPDDLERVKGEYKDSKVLDIPKMKVLPGFKEATYDDIQEVDPKNSRCLDFLRGDILSKAFFYNLEDENIKVTLPGGKPHPMHNIGLPGIFNDLFDSDLKLLWIVYGWMPVQYTDKRFFIHLQTINSKGLAGFEMNYLSENENKIYKVADHILDLIHDFKVGRIEAIDPIEIEKVIK